MGAHQQLDRLSRRRLKELLGEADADFPSFKQIVRFEGKDGPDGVKLKSPAQNEPWHYIDPLGEDHGLFFEQLMGHYHGLVGALRMKDETRSAFEAAWLAHAVVDGLTPAHHFPYEAKIEELRGGKDRHSRTTVVEKAIFRGETKKQTIGNMYRVYGPKGLYASHHLFEFGVMLLLRPLRLKKEALPSKNELNAVAKIGPEEYFLRSAREIAVLDLYGTYVKHGWTTKLSNQVRHQLAPTIVKTVSLIWYDASRKAGLCA